MIGITEPKFNKTYSFLDKLDKFDARPLLEQFGRLGVGALSAATGVGIASSRAG